MERNIFKKTNLKRNTRSPEKLRGTFDTMKHLASLQRNNKVDVKLVFKRK